MFELKTSRLVPFLYPYKCANDAKKNDPNIYFHMEPGQNLNPWRKSIVFLLLDDFHRFHVEIYIRIIFLCIIIRKQQSDA